MDIEGLASALREEARAVDERRLLVLAGGADRTREAAETALAAADIAPADATYLGTAATPWERRDPRSAGELLGTTHQAIVLDCHDECRPNAIGRAAGAVDGGGLLVLLAPPLDAWPTRRDGFDESLAVPPYTVGDVSGHFRARLVSLLQAHPGIAIVDVDAGEVRRRGLTDPAPRRPSPLPGPPPDHAFPAAAYGRCLTGDQIAAVSALETLRDSDTAVVVEADRGRGKSSAAGLAAGALALAGRDVLVTAPAYRNAAEVFARAEEVLADENALSGRDGGNTPRLLETPTGRIRFETPTAATDLPGDPDVVFVDEAAALPVRVLERFLAAPAVAFTTTIHGYEGAGRGFSVRFRDRLDESDREVIDVGMTDPIRYAAGDPVEVWTFRALLLDARPAVDPLVADATPETVRYRRLDAADLLADEHLLREVFGLLVLAHYRTEPNDLARLLDAPNVSVRALTHGGHVVSVALLAREGNLPADLRASMYEGERVRGNMIPDVLTSQLRDEAAGVPEGERVMRIATHPAVRSRGLGSRLLDAIREERAAEVDWLGTGYGATPDLVDFWADNGFHAVHLSTTRNEASGEHSAVMLAPTSDRGVALHDRHTAWFLDRVEGMLTDPLDDVDPDVVRAVLRSVAGGRVETGTGEESGPGGETGTGEESGTAEGTGTGEGTGDGTADGTAVDLSEWEWRVLAGLPHGASIHDSAPAALGTLTLHHLVVGRGPDTGPGPATAEGSDDLLTARQERLLVRKALQRRSWGDVAEALDFHSHAECMRALGEAVGPLLSRYGDAFVRDELERYG
ncbi:MAG: tRNA(Met) cytidine acetyltransferase TmcA [Haloarculaceae archaeon]